MTVLDIFRFLSVFAIGIAAGTLVAVLLGVIPTLRALPPAQALKTKQLLDPLIDRYQPPTVVVSAVSAVVILIHGVSSEETIFTIIGLVGAVCVGIVSGVVNRRINATMGKWPADTVPSEYQPLMARWIQFHMLRTSAAVIALAAFTLAIINP